MVEQATAPDTPGTGQVVIYPNTDGVLCTKDDAGTVHVAPALVAAGTLYRVQAGVLRQLLETTTLATNGTIAAGTGTSGRHIAIVYSASDGKFAVVAVEGAGGTLIYGDTGTFSGTKDTGSRINVYAESNIMYIQNKQAGSISVACFVFN
jgi:hypothetical protein